MRKQQTIAQSVFLNGFGFWSGQDVQMEFRPAPENTGVRFIRSDLPDSPPVPAVIASRIDKDRQTSLGNGQIRFDMVEHVLATLAGLQIDNCDIYINGSEIPGLDGSSLCFADLLEKSGILTQNAPRKYRRIKKKIVFQYDNSFIEARPSKNGETCFGYSLCYDCPDGSPHPIGHQKYAVNLTPKTFRSELMSARTFLLKEEANYLLSQGLCQRVSAKDVLVFDQNGPMDNTLRYPDECARHKVLDMIGDFNLASCDWIGEFYACRTGHRHNAQALTELCGMIEPE